MIEFLYWFIAALIFFAPLAVTLFQRFGQRRDISAIRWRVVSGVAVCGWLAAWLFSGILGIYVNVLWFKELGFTSVFWTVFWTKWVLRLVAFGISFAYLWLVTSQAKRIAPALPADYKPEERYNTVDWEVRSLTASILRLGLILLVAVFISGVVGGEWQKFLLYSHQVGSNITEPIFGKSISFYLFTYPIYTFLLGCFAFLSILGWIGLSSLHLFYYFRSKDAIRETSASEAYEGRVIKNVILNLLPVVLLVIGAFLIHGIYGLVFSERGVVFGASFTDVHWQILMNWICIALTVLLGLDFLLAGIKKSFKMVPLSLIAYGVIVLLISTVIPAIIQKYSVRSNEVAKETPYIEYSIDLTRKAYGLVKVEEREFPVAEDLALEDVLRDESTVGNIRVWDWRALAPTLGQQQEIRSYYDFPDVDIDRYTLGGYYRQVMLALRELPPSELPPRSRTWLNEHFVYTHGYGACMNDVSELTPEGLPQFLVKDIPSKSDFPEVQIERPEIYFGERTWGYNFVRTGEKEFDYPMGDDNAYAFYEGSGGIRISSSFRKFAFAKFFGELNILTAKKLNADSRIMFRKQIKTRVGPLAPFLIYDNDPYSVICDGRIFWIWDAYTISKYYPYSEPYKGSDREMNYMRNSVKVVIDAYNGNVSFYVFDEDDPIIKTWQGVFPALFKSRSEFPQGLVAHLRYPEDFLKVQARMYSIFHMKDPQVFYNKEDLWEIAHEIYGTDEREILPFYVIIKLPGEKKEEFLQMIPFTPTQKQNLIAWFAGRCDGDNYGKILVYRLPKSKMINGPMQVEARISQDREMSAMFTLWGQGGSTVIRGNLLVIPIKNSLIYVKPIYIQGTEAKMPELKQIIVVYGNKLAWGQTFDEALRKVFSASIAVPEFSASAVAAGGGAMSASQEASIQLAGQYFKEYQRLTAEGKFLEAGAALENLGKVLGALVPAQSAQ